MRYSLSLPIAAVLAAATLAGPLAAQAKDTVKPWPFGKKIPPNPELGLLNKVDDVKVDVGKGDPQTITITVKAMAPRPGYTGLTLVDKPGPLNDMTFSFEIRGRPPQKLTQKPDPTEVTLASTYKGAPIAKVKTIEIYANKNCVAYSVADHTTGDCTVKMPVTDPTDAP